MSYGTCSVCDSPAHLNTSGKCLNTRECDENRRKNFPGGTQYEQSQVLRKELMEFFPELADIKERLSRLLDRAQNERPLGYADGTIDETQYRQLRDIKDKLSDLLFVQLFDSPPAAPRRSR